MDDSDVNFPERGPVKRRTPNPQIMIYTGYDYDYESLIRGDVKKVLVLVVRTTKSRTCQNYCIRSQVSLTDYL